MITPRFAKWNLIGVVLSLVLVYFWIDPVGSAVEWQRFFGRFHSAYAHLPIGFLILALALSILRAVGWMKDGDNAISITLVLASWAGLQAVMAGSWLGQMGGYPEDILFLHKMMGYSVTVLAATLLYARYVYERRVVLSMWGVTLVLLTIGSDLGGQITHGPGYVTEYAPSLARNLLGHPDPMSTRFETGAPDSVRVYDGIIAPIFAEKCVSCHGPNRERGSLRLHTKEAIGNHDGDEPLIVAGSPEESLLIKRISLPDGHEDQMPPAQDAKPISHADVELLKWWISEGASFEQTIADAEMPYGITTILQAYGLGAIRRGVFSLNIAMPDTSLISALRMTGVRVTALAENEPFLEVQCETGSCLNEPSMRELSAHIISIDFGASDATDEDIAALSHFPNLTRLDISRTEIDGSRLDVLADMKYLSYLNLYGSSVNDAALDHIAQIPNIAAVYLWQTAATSEGVERLRIQLPEAEIDFGN